MSTFELEIWNDELDYCTFYSIKCAGKTENEADIFFMRFEDETNPHYENAIIILNMLIDSIGNKYGAIDVFFDRHKNEANALPPKRKKTLPELQVLKLHFPLRLYCYRVTNSIVIIFNGGIKDSRTDQESPDLSMKFFEAQTYAKKIKSAIIDKMLLIGGGGKYLTDFNGNTDSIIL